MLLSTNYAPEFDTVSSSEFSIRFPFYFYGGILYINGINCTDSATIKIYGYSGSKSQFLLKKTIATAAGAIDEEVSIITSEPFQALNIYFVSDGDFSFSTTSPVYMQQNISVATGRKTQISAGASVESMFFYSDIMEKKISFDAIIDSSDKNNFLSMLEWGELVDESGNKYTGMSDLTFDFFDLSRYLISFSAAVV